MNAPPRERRIGRQSTETLALLRRALEEDRWTHDITTRALLPGPLRGRARVTAQARGVLSGLAAARRLARMAGVQSATRLHDGDPIRPGTVVLELSGDLRRILAIERTLLNLLMHLSGVATMTATVVQKARRTRPGFRILATRKTLPGLRDLEKAAVVDGGGERHRRDLSEEVLIKGTHLALVPIEEAIRRARLRRRVPGRVQVEVRTLDQARRAVAAGARRLLIDNRPPAAVAEIVRKLRRAPGLASLEIEVSGGIGPETVAAYARTGADAASLGRLTHSAPAIPFHLTRVSAERARPR